MSAISIRFFVSISLKTFLIKNVLIVERPATDRKIFWIIYTLLARKSQDIGSKQSLLP
jgi:hypothetical protein